MGAVRLALALIGAVGAPIYANSSPHDCAYILEHSESSASSCEDERSGRSSNGELAARARADLRRPRRARERGRAFAAEHPDALAEREPRSSEDDLFTSSTRRARPARRRAA
jgi:acyl-coenzyme A synthetase/AMP-(fatty) acid ligase